MKATTVKMAEISFDEKLFIPMPTNTLIDKAFSMEGGLYPATNVVVAGAPGVGKTTVLLDVIANIAKTGKKVLFISGEMNQIDMYGYVKRYKKFGEIDILFMGDYVDENPEAVCESILNNGYDVVLMDSMSEMQDIYQAYFKGSNEGQGTRILKMFEKYNKSHYTTFLIISQMTKSGEFVGSNKLKHMTTAFAYLRFDEIGNRYIQFTKNRRGGSANKFVYSLETVNDVNYMFEEAI